jgi:hypothetical protein
MSRLPWLECIAVIGPSRLFSGLDLVPSVFVLANLIFHAVNNIPSFLLVI